MTLAINAKVYTGNKYGSNSVTYTGPASTLSVKDRAELKQFEPKPTSVFSGVSKTTAKLTRTFTLTGVLTPVGDAICEINLSVPVGFAAADVDTMLNDMGAFLASASFKTHVKTPQIAF